MPTMASTPARPTSRPAPPSGRPSRRRVGQSPHSGTDGAAADQQGAAVELGQPLLPRRRRRPGMAISMTANAKAQRQ